MKINYKYIGIVFILMAIFLGCENTPNEPTYQKEIAIFGYLWGNKNLNADHAIMLAYTQPITDYYKWEKAAIHNANVTLTDLNSGKTYELYTTPERPGYYFNDSLLIKAQTPYQLRAEVAGKVVTATTTVPPVLKTTSKLRTDTTNYEYYDNISFEKPVFLECEAPDQIILVDMYCNESYQTAEYITEFYGHKKPENEDEYEEGSNGEPRHILGFGKYETFTSDNFPGQFVVDWYSSMIVFYGAYTLQILAIDDNYSDFITTQEYREYKSGIKGGIGVFGSMTGETYKLMVLKP